MGVWRGAQKAKTYMIQRSQWAGMMQVQIVEDGERLGVILEQLSAIFLKDPDSKYVFLLTSATVMPPITYKQRGTGGCVPVRL